MQNPNTLRKFYGPNYLLIARQARLKCFRAPAGFSLGTHKNLQPCRLPNLFSCQTSSSGRNGLWLVAKRVIRCPTRLGGLESEPQGLKPHRSWPFTARLKPCAFKATFQPNVRRQLQHSFTVNRITEVTLTPNIGLVVSLVSSASCRQSPVASHQQQPNLR